METSLDLSVSSIKRTNDGATVVITARCLPRLAADGIELAAFSITLYPVMAQPAGFDQIAEAALRSARQLLHESHTIAYLQEEHRAIEAALALGALTDPLQGADRHRPANP